MSMLATIRNNILVTNGDQAPFCYGMLNKVFYSFEAQAGRTAVVLLAGALAPAVMLPLISAFQHHASDFSVRDADLLLIIDGESDHAAAYDALALDGIKLVHCLPEYFGRCGFDGSQPWIFIMDRNQRVLDQIDPAADTSYASTALQLVDMLPREEPRFVALPAPVLAVPHIFSRSFCRTLINHFENGPHTPGGMASMDAAGKGFHKVDLDKKHRDDCVLEHGDPLRDQVVNALARFCLPEIKKAFQFDVQFVDRILIARYDETGGYFRRHRDNVAASVAYRQFAISINLNTEDYEGGYLTFPEFNGHTYRPGTGAGIIFSSSLLHEAHAVTRGQRFVLLTFLHNAEAEARRLDYLERAKAAAA
jgi:predicted 2-oxoglutarate/Fe(II)-dependent dioxygenase YbiX